VKEPNNPIITATLTNTTPVFPAILLYEKGRCRREKARFIISCVRVEKVWKNDTAVNEKNNR
jgi:hypothetical protein